MDRTEDQDWPLRTWALALLGAIVALAIHFIADQAGHFTDKPHLLALATFLGIGGIAFAFTLERERIGWSAVFALVAGAVVASVIFWNGGPNDWNASDGWRIVCAALAVAIAAPLFQAARAEGRWHLPYEQVHDQAWTNVILWFAAWLFVGIVWLLAFLLGALFALIGIDLVEKALREGVVASALTGASFGGAVGLLRDRGRIVGLLQRVARAVLAVLAPVLGAGLILFLLSLPFTGLAPLWDATKSTTPILLGCIVGALILANAVIGDSPEDEARHPALRFGAMALGVAMLPLGAIAAISVALRIGQYGLTPSRLWAVLFVFVACFYGLGYWWALARRRLGWAGAVRGVNLALAIGLCALALLLSTPLVSFGALSARDQVARLQSGRTSVGQFDWAAMAFDFGPAGRRMLGRLKAQGATAAIRRKATTALAAKDRWTLAGEQKQAETRADFVRDVTILPKRVPLPQDLLAAVGRAGGCGAKAERAICFLYYRPGSDEAALVSLSGSCDTCLPIVTALSRRPDGWKQGYEVGQPPATDKARARRLREAARRGEIELRTVERRQIFVGGEPLGDTFP
ncbi:MAG TPA: DUF4153 domain-containing protein [Sphingomonadaceae bacterium]|nr:DUF4153 domain-containing protein [Sphingomonadaceae bacterium]